MADTEMQVIQTLPLLPSDYPLFDWKDWPDSRAALVQGGETRKFEKDCWNAIMDALTGGIEAAGLELYRAEEGLTPNHLKMLTGTYGRMTAALFNTVLLCIDDITPFKWRWDVDRSFRGFVNRWYFIKSYREYGKKADIFYPEYILELVRRINLLLEILRGTAPTLDVAAQGRGRSIVSPGLRADPSVPIIWSRIVRTLVNPGSVNVGIGLPLAVPVPPRQSQTLVELLPGKAAQISEYIHISQRVRASGVVKPRKLLEAEHKAQSKTFAALDIHNVAEYSADWLASSALTAQLYQAMGAAMAAVEASGTIHKVGADTALPYLVSCRLQFRSRNVAQADRLPLVTTGASGLYTSKIKAAAETLICTQAEKAVHRASTNIALEGRSVQSEPLRCSVLVGAEVEAEAVSGAVAPTSSVQSSGIDVGISIVKGKLRPAWAEQRSRATAAAQAEQIMPVAAKVEAGSVTRLSCSLDTGWLPPVWVDGGLWIRQAYSAVQNDDGSLEVS